MRKAIIALAIFVVLLLLPTGLRCLQFFQLGGAEVAPPPVYDPQQVSEISQVPTPAAATFVDEPSVGEGFVLLDRAHDNQFTLDEIGHLDGRLAARGFELVQYDGGDLARALRAANSFVVITPLADFDTEEIRAVTDFVDRGGRLLLIGDPTRFGVAFNETEFTFEVLLESDKLPLNSLANEFNIVFNGDYLYNTVENEGNFRNIILQGGSFAEDILTDGLDRIAFYSAHSLQVGRDGKALLTADDNTWSSATDRPGGLVLGASSMNGRVLALGDIHFLIEPYYTVYDNGRFIAQIADFLTEVSGRGFVLADFPYFYRDPIDLVYTGAPDLGPEAFDEIIALQDAFRRVDRDLQLAATPADDHDVLYLGLFNQADEVQELLASEGISLTIQPEILTADELAAAEEEAAALEEANADKEGTPPVEATPFAEETPTPEEPVETIRLIQSALGNVQMSGTAVIFLHEDGGQRSVVVLAASADGLQNTVDRVLDLIPLNADYALSDCLVQDNLALCPTNVSNEEVEAELLSGGEPSEAVTPDEEPTGDGEPDDTGIGDTGGGFETTLDAVPQGSIGLDETVDGTLGPDESHAWTFSDGPATIDIVMSSEVLDGVLELYDPDNVWLDSSDSGYSGDGEALYAIDIPDDGVYTIVVRDYWGDEGDYSLSVTAVAPPDQTGDSGDTGDTTTADIGNIFIFVDDDGEPLDGGITSGAEMADILGQEHIVILWTTSIDGPLQEDTLDGTDLLIWDTGDYLDSEGFYDPDTEIIVNYLDGGAGSLLMVGSAPLFFNYFDLASLADLEVGADDPILLDGFASGDVITLDQPYQTIASEFLGDDLTDEDIVMFNRGPESEQAGTIAAVATVDSLGTDQRAVVLLFPFTALPMAVQEPLLTNLINWFAQ